MPLNRPALSLGAGPRGVQDARRWVVETCHDIGRPELAECAELGVSELVTNALLHGAPPIQVRVRGTREHPRVEVHDGSRERPLLPSADEDDEDDDLLLTFGRGLSIVARCSDAWGAEIEDDGKTVWFAPARSFAEDDGVPGLITGDEDPPVAGPEDPVQIVVRGVPLDLYVAFQRHFRELRREVRLLALAHESDYPLAKDLSDLFASLERQLREGIGLDQLESAVAAGESETQVDLVTSRESTRTMERFIEMLDLADEFCRQERLLSLARTDEQRRFQQWYLGEFVRQGRGEPPLAWPDAAATPGQQSTVS
ncbi:Histidine kinase-like ATPase domain-containing protein [Nocardioides lianchengensis]|uniref:Histidine kinase-like ATPase domain-containing protein n=1 Tax=Nocardioides lianchengensis TaxID=1045774 RepID=A0A1G6XV83_9ACTN|nr:Histidine kinase-like ATPase domain-containing protein [Nocardioides lianchengensis]